MAGLSGRVGGKWRVRKGVCPECYQDGWVVFDNMDSVFGCRTTFSEAIFYAIHKARVLAEDEGWQL